MDHTSYNVAAKHGTAGGFLLVLIANITSADLLKTIVLAATGAAVSFIVSYAMKWASDRLKR